MIIACHTVDEFLENITEDIGLVENTIWSSITKNPVDGNKRTASQFDVNFQASAVLIFKDGGECLLELGIDCGKDYHDASQDYAGLEEAEEHKSRIQKFCNGRSMLLRPGIVSM